MRGGWWSVGAVALVAALASPAVAGDPFVDAVVDFRPGSSAGFGEADLPGIVLGPPVGAGVTEGSLHVVALGNGGAITLEFRDNAVCDGPGPDFVVFENAFHAGDPSGVIFTEFGIVAVSEDGVEFVEFPYDTETLTGLAGQTPVYSTPDNGIDPTNPQTAGGDPFDLATVGLSRIAFVRITDPGAAIADVGNNVPPGNSGGFDLDAIAAVHSCDPIGTVTPGVTTAPTATPTATPLPTAGDANGDGTVDESDRRLVAAEIFDGDEADFTDAVANGAVRGFPGVDVNRDGSVGAADLALQSE